MCAYISHSITADVDVVQMSRDAEFFLADGVVITGGTTASPADVQELNSRSQISILLPYYLITHWLSNAPLRNTVKELSSLAQKNPPKSYLENRCAFDATLNWLFL
jgi:hypothetical protein